MTRGLATIRHQAAIIVRDHRWLPGLVTLAFFVATVLLLILRADWWWEATLLAPSLIAAFAWGYIARAMRAEKFPPLSHLRRRQYSETWNALAGSLAESFAAVAGQRDEASLRRSSLPTVRNLLEMALITQHDDVLEIGCGIARIGRELAPYCRTWTGADISSSMLTHAADRLREGFNVRLVCLKGVGLSEFPEQSFDVVYLTNMLMHLDEMDRWAYVAEAFRVLRPAGRILFDNVDIESDAGWSMFANDAKRYQVWERPPYMPRYSTAAELMAYAKRAGFEEVSVHRRPPVAIVIARKNGARKSNPAFAAEVEGREAGTSVLRQ